MPNTLDANGLLTKTRDELITELTASFETIYGSDINLDSDTPDGQMLNIYVQGYLDLLDLLRAVYTSMDPDQAIGRTLDSRVAFNGIQRQGGTKTVTDISIVTTEAVTLYGVDQDANEIFTVSDDSGNKFQLIATESIPSASTTVLSFQAEEPGEILTLPNTITNAESVVLGVSSVNNPTTYTSLGVDEESDADLKIRRRRSVSLASQGFTPGLKAALENINGVINADVFENDTSEVDADGTTEHTIWVIIEGAGDPALIADAIYRKRSLGVRTRGEQTFSVSQTNGSSFTVRWDNILNENVFVFADISSVDGVNFPNISSIETELAEKINITGRDFIDMNLVSTAIKEIDPNSLVNSVYFINGKIQNFVIPTAPTSGGFKFSYNGVETAVIDFDDTDTEIQTKLRAISGLESVQVLGDLSASNIGVQFIGLNSVDHLLLIKDSTLDNPIQYFFGTETIVKASSKVFKLIFTDDSIISTDLITSPVGRSLFTSTDQQFTSFGGYGDLSYSIEVDNSGASITAGGLYTSGATPGIDTVRVEDEIGNFKLTNITVV